MDKDKILDDIFKSDLLGILEVKSKNPIITTDDRLVSSFEELNDFYQKNNREPKKTIDMSERGLYSRLEGIRNNSSKVEALKKYDRFNLLTKDKTININSIDDIFSNDTLGILGEDDEDIFTLKNIPKKKVENSPDFIAKRKPCKDFEKFEHIFIKVHQELNQKQRELKPFQSEKDIQSGFYFVLNGIIGYVLKVGNEFTFNRSRNKNTRLKIIFENGTQSNMLLRSLSVALYRDGKVIFQLDENLLDKLTKNDKQNGYIYILKSLSNDDRIITKKNLYKIGFSTTQVETRVKNANKEPTYLMADVKIISIYEVYNVNPHKLEQLIHKFFNNSCLDIEIYDKNGKNHKPKEWFIAPLDVIEEVIELIINGNVIYYRYDEVNEKIIRN